jgi:hypothetical protein
MPRLAKPFAPEQLAALVGSVVGDELTSSAPRIRGGWFALNILPWVVIADTRGDAPERSREVRLVRHTIRKP